MSQATATEDVGTFESYVEAVLDVLAAAPDRPVVTTGEGVVVRAADLHHRVLRLAGELAADGVGPGCTVTLLTGNTVEAVVARYAANLTGARVVSLYEGMSPATMAHIMASVDSSLLLVDGQRRDTARELQELADVPRMLSLGPGDFAEDVLARAAHRPALPMRGRVGPDDHCRIGHTGGTTGIPKGIPATHGPLRRGLDFRFENAGVPPRLLVCTSLSHIAGFLVDQALYQNGSVVLRHAFEPGEVLAAVERERVTHTWLLPPLIYRLLDHPDLATTDLSSLTRITYGGTAASPTRMRRAAEVLGPVLYGIYGQSEAQLITTVSPAELLRTGPGGRLTVGRAAPGVEIAIRGADGTDLPPGEPGEIVVRSPAAMPGYWKQPELTAQVLRDGWVHTGDVGCLDEDGYLYIVDRIKEMIVVVGGHVYPSELEDLLLGHPTVAQCTVFGTRDEDAVERVHAAVVPVPGQRPSLPEIRDYVTTRKGRLYAPDALHLVDALPLTAVGKPDRRHLADRFPG
ncbi:AMP-binding protein [Streptomyces sp. NPDC049906]|uniref:AMP-binding protein n=1 Tax=Streptomyces sp. NPDC049906 TaxID=3155656 RepID=UPI00343AE0FD